jgi:hypothetical protein
MSTPKFKGLSKADLDFLEIIPEKLLYSFGKPTGFKLFCRLVQNQNIMKKCDNSKEAYATYLKNIKLEQIPDVWMGDDTLLGDVRMVNASDADAKKYVRELKQAGHRNVVSAYLSMDPFSRAASYKKESREKSKGDVPFGCLARLSMSDIHDIADFYGFKITEKSKMGACQQLYKKLPKDAKAQFLKLVKTQEGDMFAPKSSTRSNRRGVQYANKYLGRKRGLTFGEVAAGGDGWKAAADKWFDKDSDDDEYSKIANKGDYDDIDYD